MVYSHILWDFNGTLLDDVVIGMESINGLLSSRNLPMLASKEDYYRHFRFPIEEYYRSVGFDFETDPYDVLAQEWVDRYRALEHTAPLCEGALEVLKYVAEKGIPQIVFSATQKQMLEQQLAALGIDGFFSEILGSQDIYAEGKTAVGLRWVQETNPARAVLIGDTAHDAHCALEMGIDCVLVAGGHSSKASLDALGLPVLNSLRELPLFLEKEKR